MSSWHVCTERKSSKEEDGIPLQTRGARSLGAGESRVWAYHHADAEVCQCLRDTSDPPESELCISGKRPSTRGRPSSGTSGGMSEANSKTAMAGWGQCRRTMAMEQKLEL